VAGYISDWVFHAYWLLAHLVIFLGEEFFTILRGKMIKNLEKKIVKHALFQKKFPLSRNPPKKIILFYLLKN